MSTKAKDEKGTKPGAKQKRRTQTNSYKGQEDNHKTPLTFPSSQEHLPTHCDFILQDDSDMDPERLRLRTEWLDRSAVRPLSKYTKMGVLKHTPTQHHEEYDNTSNEVELQHLIDDAQAESAIICAGAICGPWLAEKLDPSKVQQTWVLNEKQWQQGMMESLMARYNWTELTPHYVAHGELKACYLLLFSPKLLRVIMTPASLLPGHWGEDDPNARFELISSVLVLDLPKRPLDACVDQESPRQFRDGLLSLLRHQGLPEDCVSRVLEYDFEEACDLGLVHSMYV
jgi:hypothetical protein